MLVTHGGKMPNLWKAAATVAGLVVAAEAARRASFAAGELHRDRRRRERGTDGAMQ